MIDVASTITMHKYDITPVRWQSKAVESWQTLINTPCIFFFYCTRVRTGLKITWVGRTFLKSSWKWNMPWAGPRSAVGNMSGYRCVSDCRCRGGGFDPGSVPFFRGDWSWNDFYGHSPPFRWFIQEGLVSVTSESMCTNYWLTACTSLPRKKCG